MDFLDPKIERRNRMVLLIGYCLVALAIAIATLVLLYSANGYGVNRQGKVTQNGLLFVSSQPSGAAISLNGQPYKSNTNTRAVVPAGTYKLQISQAGYRTWQRQVVVNGGDVQHFDYPFLFPSQLKTTPLDTLAADPSVALQSPDKRWLLLGDANNQGSFTQYDLKDPAKPVRSNINLPDGSFTPGDGAQTWTLVEWAADNQHVLLLHTYASGATTSHEYVLLDRDTPVDSVNLTKSLNLNANQTLNLFNAKVDQFYAYDKSTESLQKLNATDGSVASQLDHVLAFKPYGSDQLLYVTDHSPTGKDADQQVSAVLEDGQRTITLRMLPANATSYVLNMAQYSGDWYVAVGANNDSSVYIYKNPQSEPTPADGSYPAAWRSLPVPDPSYLAFSSNTQFILAESGQDFVVYDVENMIQYHYHATEPIDSPQTHAVWMDGDRLLYVSGGKLLIFDYDYRNRQTLEPANANYPPFFANDYSYIYNLRPGDVNTKPALTSTALTVTK